MARSKHRRPHYIENLTSFLDRHIPNDYVVEYNNDGSFTIDINDKGSLALRSLDHDCGGPEDGCSACAMLVDLNLIPELDDVWRDL